METETIAHNRNAALALAAAGLPIFPAGVSKKTEGEGWNKKPLIGGWKDKASTDPAVIEHWWRVNPHAVPAIELGSSNLVVLDGDRHGGPDGVTALNETLAGTPRHPVSLTAGGGEHHIFRQPARGEPLGNGTGSLPNGVDVRGQGGWIVAPGSIRPDGNSWRSDPEAPSLIEAFRSGTIPEIPKHIVKLIRPAPSLATGDALPKMSISERAVAHIRPAGLSASREVSAEYCEALLAGVCREISSTQEGNRNNVLNSCSFRVGRAVATGKLDRDVAEQSLLRAANDNGLMTDDGDSAVRATLQSGLSAGLRHPLATLTDRPSPQPIGNGLLAARKPFVLHWHDNDNAPPTPKWLVKKMLPETGVAIIAGQWSSGKTFVALHLAECVATCKPFAGRLIKRRGGTLFMAAEAAGDIPIRLRGIAAAPLSGKRDRLPFTWIEEVPSISEPDAIELMVEIARKAASEMQEKFNLPIALIVIDTMAAAARFENENDAAQAQAVMNVLQALARATGALVVAVDHFGKSTDVGTRGSSAKEASADAVLSLIAPQTKEGVVEHRTLAIRKLRGGSTGDRIGFSLKPVSFGADEDGDEITTCVVEFKEGPVAARTNFDPWKVAKDLNRALLVVLAERGQDMHPFHDQGPKVRAAPLKAVRAELFKAYPSEGSDDAKRQAWKRQLKRARDNGVVGTREIDGEDFIWLAASAVAAPLNISSPQAATGTAGA